MSPITKGRMVLVTLREGGREIRHNGSAEHPAVVTAVHGANLINARVFVDGVDNPLWVTSVEFADTPAMNFGGHSWRWPPRS